MGGRSWIVLAATLAAAISVSAVGATRSMDFRDDFTTFDTRRWTAVDRPFGFGKVDSANVTVANGLLGVKLPAGTLDGGEVRSTSLYRYGSYRVWMKVANAPSSVTAFFLYKRPDYAQELDIEIFDDSSREVMFTTYSGGRQTHTVTTLLPFDATAGFHEYAIEYDPGSVRFLVDGVQLQAWSNAVTKSSMYVYVNAWFPSWLSGERPSSDRFTYVDWIEYVGR
jgi:beta-glucanase (GH16 family)